VKLADDDRAARPGRAARPARSRFGAQWLSAACACMMLLAAAGVPAHAQANTHVIVVEQMRFTPAELTVRRGDQVLWVNRDPFPHTATATAHAFDSGSIAPQASWRYVARERGSFPYGCAFHPSMRGLLIVR
jgi:plastocyanin